MSEDRPSPEALVPDTPEPPAFDAAVRTGVQRLQESSTVGAVSPAWRFDGPLVVR
jgi:hypothetical protein